MIARRAYGVHGLDCYDGLQSSRDLAQEENWSFTMGSLPGSRS